MTSQLDHPFAGFAGTAAVVTGAAGGLGQAMVLALVSRGATVIAADRDEEGLQRLKHIVGEEGTLVPIVADISTHEGHAGIESAAAATGLPTSLWVNNAGIVIREPAETLTTEQWDAMAAVNVRSVLLGSQAAYRLMQPWRTGSIINLSSVTATRVIPLRAGYGTSKASVEELTRYLAVEWGPTGIRVNAVAPGFILTPISHLNDASEAELHQTLERVPLGRLGKPEDIAGIVLALASPLFGYVTGQVLRADGGWTL